MGCDMCLSLSRLYSLAKRVHPRMSRRGRGTREAEGSLAERDERGAAPRQWGDPIGILGSGHF
eukprot:scaffold26245_cov57-Phaeocystis_antarctica.AAC.3